MSDPDLLPGRTRALNDPAKMPVVVLGVCSIMDFQFCRHSLGGTRVPQKSFQPWSSGVVPGATPFTRGMRIPRVSGLLLGAGPAVGDLAREDSVTP